MTRGRPVSVRGANPLGSGDLPDTLGRVVEPTGDAIQDEGSRTTRIALSAASLDSALAGSLPCVTCRYELKGLSIRGVCPECGTAVRATILYKVDPQAEEFQPIAHPRTLAAGLVLWSAGALAAAGACWALRIVDGFEEWGIAVPDMSWASWVAVAATLLSGVGSLTLIRPVPRTPIMHTIGSLIGALAYIPMIWAMWNILLELDPGRTPPYFGTSVQSDRVWLRLMAGASIVIVLLGTRLSARDLVKRSMVMRTGRVDRQTLWGMAIVAAVTMVGDGLRLAAAAGWGMDPDLLRLAGTLIIAVGSGLLTLGLVGALIDTLRIARAVLIPSPSLTEVLGTGAG